MSENTHITELWSMQFTQEARDALELLAKRNPRDSAVIISDLQSFISFWNAFAPNQRPILLKQQKFDYKKLEGEAGDLGLYQIRVGHGRSHRAALLHVTDRREILVVNIYAKTKQDSTGIAQAIRIVKRRRGGANE